MFSNNLDFDQNERNNSIFVKTQENLAFSRNLR